VLQEDGVVLVGQDEVLLGGEVAEDGAGSHLRRCGDLIDRGGVVALPLEQP
jgi:hypothetical protein